MIARAVAFCARHPWPILAAALLSASGAALLRRTVPWDILPELADPQVAIVADWMGHPAAEVDESLARVLTRALQGVPGAVAVRASSMTGMAYVDVVFSSEATLDAGRAAVAERIAAARAALPEAARVQIAPDAASTGWVYQYALVDPTHGQTALTLRQLQDRVFRPSLSKVPGVAEVASVGGDLQQVMVDIRSDELRARAIASSDVIGAVRGRLASAPKPDLRELKQLPVAGATLAQLASVRLEHEMPGGIADVGGLQPAVGGIVIARRGAALEPLLATVHREIDRLRAALPAGVTLVTVYDRSELIARVRHTLLVALAEEVAAVAAVVLLFLLHGGSALVPLATLPVVLLFAFAVLRVLGIPATIMSIGGIAIALGIAVDVDVVALEACHRAIEGRPPGGAGDTRRERLAAASAAIAPPVLTSLVITALSFLPVFAFAGETGRLLRPLAITKTAVIAAAALVSISLAPALRDRLLRGRIVPEFENPLTRALVRGYRPFVHFALSRPALTLAAAALALASSVPVALRLGGEFLPRVDEGELLYMPSTLPGAPDDELAGQLRRQDAALTRSRGVASVFGKLGRADTATDPAPLSMAEIIVRLRPRSEWPMVARARWYSGWAPAPLRRALRLLWPEEEPATTGEMIEALDRAARLPGWVSAWTAPARARLDMMATGIRTPVALRISATDPARLDALADGAREVVARVPGTRSVSHESLGVEMAPRFDPRPGLLLEHGVDPELARETARLLLSGGDVGALIEGGTPLRVRVTEDHNLRGLVERLRELTVRSKAGVPVPLALLGAVSHAPRAASMRTEGGALVADLQIDVVEGTDLLRYVETARGEVERAAASGALRLRPGERFEWIGQYQLLAAARHRLQLVAALVAVCMLALLYLQFRSLAEALIVLASVPFALVGSVWTLYALGYPLSAPVWVGLLAVTGLAMQTAVVMVVYIDQAFHRRVAEGRLKTRDDIVEAHAEGTVQRLRPKLMTIATMAAGLLPLLWAEGPGAEVMRRVAAPMVGGLFSSAFLTLEVLPVLYTIWRSRQLQRARRLGVGIDAVAGGAPVWAKVAGQR